MSLKCLYLGSESVLRCPINEAHFFVRLYIPSKVVKQTSLKLRVLIQLVDRLLAPKQLKHMFLFMVKFLNACFLASVITFPSCFSRSQSNWGMWLPGYMCRLFCWTCIVTAWFVIKTENSWGQMISKWKLEFANLDFLLKPQVV